MLHHLTSLSFLWANTLMEVNIGVSVCYKSIGHLSGLLKIDQSYFILNRTTTPSEAQRVAFKEDFSIIILSQKNQNTDASGFQHR